MNKKLMGIFVLGIFSLVSLVSSHTGDDEIGHHSMMGSYGTSGMLFGWLFMLLVIVALVLLVIWLIKQIQKK